MSAGKNSLKAVLKMRMISELSLFTIVLNFLSQRTGTVNLGKEEGINASDCTEEERICEPASIVRIDFEIEVLDVFGMI